MRIKISLWQDISKLGESEFLDVLKVLHASFCYILLNRENYLTVAIWEEICYSWVRNETVRNVVNNKPILMKRVFNTDEKFWAQN